MLNKTPRAPERLSTTVHTPRFRMSFPTLLEPRENPGGVMMYGVTMLYPPRTNLDSFRLALENAIINKKGPDRQRWPRMKRGIKDVIVDFDAYNDQANKPLPGNWKDWTMIRANAKAEYPPKVVGPMHDADGKFPIITDKREVYGGRWARAVIDGFYFEVAGNNGLTFGLQQVQLLMRDTPFGATRAASEEVFTEMPDDYEDGDDNDFEVDTTAKKENQW